MDSAYSIINQFFGVNPLLLSRLQVEGGWNHFHVNHISDLTRYLQQSLRPLGYLVQVEPSLQIRRLDHTNRNAEPQRRFLQAVNSTLSIPELLQLDETELASYNAVVIYRKQRSGIHGTPVAWLELLSPSSKPQGQHAEIYQHKRTALLQLGLIFIELDYLHQQAPTITTAIYPQQGGSSPYRILIIDPRPNWLQGKGQIYPIAVDEKLPTIELLLNAGDVASLDFDIPFQQTYEALFFGDEVNYAMLPKDWETYSSEDQIRIISRLLAVRKKIANLEERPSKAVAVSSLNEAFRLWHMGSGDDHK
jgi:hypothetical protein